MIDEDDLRRLLADAAGSVPPPGRAPDALLAAIAEEASTPRRRQQPTRRLAAVVAAALVVVAIGAGIARDDSNEPSTSGDESAADGFTSQSGADTDEAGLAPGEAGAAGAGFTGVEAPPLAGAPGDLAVPSTPDAVAVEGAPAAGTATPEQSAVAGPPQPAQPADSARIIKTGSLDLEVREGAFDGTVDRITAQTIGLGGYVAESTTNESGDHPSGSIVVRVPADSFEALLADLRELGEVKAVGSKGTDVTAQFTDLAARLTALTATRDRLSAVLSEAANVPDILAVQDRITGVQTEIELIQGQQRLLEDQTSLATLAITLGEPGAEIVEVREDDDGLGHAWDDARGRFGDSVEGLVSWSGSAAVVAIVGLLLLAVGRLAWIAARRRMV